MSVIDSLVLFKDDKLLKSTMECVGEGDSVVGRPSPEMYLFYYIDSVSKISRV